MQYASLTTGNIDVYCTTVRPLSSKLATTRNEGERKRVEASKLAKAVSDQSFFPDKPPNSFPPSLRAFCNKFQTFPAQSKLEWALARKNSLARVRKGEKEKERSFESSQLPTYSNVQEFLFQPSKSLLLFHLLNFFFPLLFTQLTCKQYQFGPPESTSSLGAWACKKTVAPEPTSRIPSSSLCILMSSFPLLMGGGRHRALVHLLSPPPLPIWYSSTSTRLLRSGTSSPRGRPRPPTHTGGR